METIPQHLASNVHCRMLHIQHPASSKQQEYFKTFRKLKECEVFTDVTFIAQNGRSLSVHRLVLASFSPLLKEILENVGCCSTDSHHKIILPEVEYTDVEALTHIMYGVEVSVPKSRFDKIYNLASMLGIPASKLNTPELFLFHPKKTKDHQQTQSVPSNPPPLCCWYCYSTFDKLDAFQLHLDTAHKNDTLPSHKPSHKCPKCKKVFSTMYKLRTHLLTHPTSKRKRGDHEYAEPVKVDDDAEEQVANKLPKKSISDHPYANPNESTPAPAPKVIEEHPEVVQARVDRVSSDHSYGTRQRLASIRESDHAYSTQIPESIEVVQVLPVRTSQPPPGSEVIAQVSQINLNPSVSNPPKGAAKRKASLKNRKSFEPVAFNIGKNRMPNKYNCEFCGITFNQPYKRRRHVQGK